MPYVLAIDQGTQSTRAAVLDMDGRITAVASSSVSSTQPQMGWVEQNAEEIVQSTEAAIEQVLSEIPSLMRSSIDCCGIATQRSTVLSWSDSGEALSPALNWQDTRGEAMLVNVHKYAEEIKKISGLPLSAHYGATKLRWLIDKGRSGLNDRFGPVSSFLLSRLSNTETNAVDHGNAQRMQLFDVSTKDWSPRLSDLFAVPTETLPTCKPIYHDFGELNRYRIPITAMNGDQNAAWFGSGLPTVGTALVNIGSGAFVLASKQVDTDLPELLSTISYSDKTNCDFLLEATVNGAGNAIEWLSRRYGIKEYRTLLQSSLEQITQPPIFLNTVGGLGSPWWKPGLPPVFEVDTADFPRSEMLAAVCESILFLVYHNIQIIQQSQSITELQLSGGLSRVNQMCQKLANLSNLKVRRINDSESTIRGIAWIAAGQPKTWGLPEQDIFQPQKEPGLSVRFEMFLELLNRYIEVANHE